MKKQTLAILAILCMFSSIVLAAPDWWDNPDNFASWTQYFTTGTASNAGGSQAQEVIAKLDVPNLGIERNTKDIWVQIEWEATTGSGSLLTSTFTHKVMWTYDECPASPSEDLTNIDGVDFLSHEGTFTPTHEVTGGNTFDNGNEFSLQIDEQPECERLEIHFSVDPNSEINYRIEVQTVCWGVVEVAGDCPTPSPGLYPGATDVVFLEFTMDTGTGGDVWWDKVALITPTGVNSSTISSVKIQTAGGTTLSGPTAWNPTESFTIGFSDYDGQTFDISADELINENQKTFQVLVNVAESAVVGTTVDLLIPNKDLVTVITPADALNDNFPVQCNTQIRTLSTNLENFSADMDDEGITLFWYANKNNNTAGFNIYRQEGVGDDYVKLNSELITVSPLSTPNKKYSYMDDNVIEAVTYSYMIEEISTSGQSEKSRPLSITYHSSTAVENRFQPDEFALAQNYPNPFNPSTTISYNLAAESHVELQVYDVTGRLITELINANQSAGAHQIKWNGVNNQGETVANGIYLLTMRAGEHFFTRKMTLMR